MILKMFSRICFALLIFASANNMLANAQQTDFTEYEIKAAFLFNFAKFVEWPDSSFDVSQAKFTIGILGQDPFGEKLDRIVYDQKVDKKELTVKRFRSIEDVHNCQILFVSRSEERRLKYVLTQLGNRSILTVSEIENFVAQGGIIQLMNKENKVRFLINPTVANENDLKISARLLKLAENLKLSYINGKK